MFDILIYLLDKDFEDEVRQIFSQKRFRFLIVYDMEEVVKSCQQELHDLAIIWPAAYEETMDFLTVLNINYFSFMPVIAVVTDSQQTPKLASLPLVEIIRLPLPKFEFYQIIEQVIEDVDIQATYLEGKIWQGVIEEYTLMDLIQMIEGGGQDALLTIQYSDKIGHVYFKDGKLLHASFMGKNELEALKRMVFWRKGNFTVKFTQVEVPNNHLIKPQEGILNKLMTYNAKFQKTFRTLPGLFQEIFTNPFLKPESLTPIQQKIVNICQTPIKIFDLLLLMEEDSIIVGEALRELLQKRIIGKREEIEALILEEEKKSGITKIFSLFSSLFHKKSEPVAEITSPEEPVVEILSPKLEVAPVLLSENEIKQIQKKLNARVK